MRIVFVGDIKQRGNKDEAANSKINNATGKMEHAGVEEVLHSVAPPKNGQKKTTVRVHRGFNKCWRGHYGTISTPGKTSM